MRTTLAGMMWGWGRVLAGLRGWGWGSVPWGWGRDGVEKAYFVRGWGQTLTPCHTPLPSENALFELGKTCSALLCPFKETPRV